MTPDFWWHVAVTMVSAGAIIITLKVDMGWIKSQLRHHIANDDTRFNYVQQRLDKIADDAKP